MLVLVCFTFIFFFFFSVVITGLTHNTQYKVIVDAKNGVSDQAGTSNAVSIIFTTKDIGKSSSTLTVSNLYVLNCF